MLAVVAVLTAGGPQEVVDAAVALGIALQLCDWANCLGHHRVTLGARFSLFAPACSEYQ